MNEWISVEKQLPEDGQLVLIQLTDGSLLPRVAKFRLNHKKSFILPFQTDADIEDVAFWIALPELPKP